MRATDGAIGALLLNGQNFVTSPNQSCIFQPAFGTTHSVFIHANNLYGDNDPTCWPQAYNSVYCYYGAISHPGSLPAHKIIWWVPTHDHFISFKHSMTTIRGLGKLSELKLAELQCSVLLLLCQATTYISSTPVSQVPYPGPVNENVRTWVSASGGRMDEFLADVI
jgi:hypothetical protein